MRARVLNSKTGHAIRQLSRGSICHELSVTASIGVASSSQEQIASAEDVIQAADKALYRAKAART
jgi:PleD family two-component response regulator